MISTKTVCYYIYFFFVYFSSAFSMLFIVNKNVAKKVCTTQVLYALLMIVLSEDI